jgi:hypothetical protein
MTSEGTSNVTLAKSCWGDAAPEWIISLAEACDAAHSSQAAVSRRLGVSGAMINQALRNCYAGRMDKLETRVRGELMNERVGCPVLGDITKRKCLDEQSRPYAATNAVRVELRRACARCANQIRRNA